MSSILTGSTICFTLPVAGSFRQHAALRSDQQGVFKMRVIILAGCAAVALAACNNTAGNNAADDVNAMSVDNMMVDQNAAMNANMDANGMIAANGAAVDANTQEMMNKDLHTNDPDTNLANGL
ncbi:MAG: hypothetical protein ABIO80_07430 [Sphingomicrobium sp.]